MTELPLPSATQSEWPSSLFLLFSQPPRKVAGGEMPLPGSPAPGDVLSIPAASSASPGPQSEIRPGGSRPFPIQMLVSAALELPRASLSSICFAFLPSTKELHVIPFHLSIWQIGSQSTPQSSKYFGLPKFMFLGGVSIMSSTH